MIDHRRRKILVTGATGYIGRWTLPLLHKKRFEVHAVSRRPRGDDTEGIKWHRCDLLTDPVTIVKRVKPDVLLHFAWITEHGHYWNSAQNLVWVEASLRLLRAFVSEGGVRAVIAGTCAEDDGVAVGSSAESSLMIYRPSLYGVAKDALRRIIDTYARETGLSWAWGRIFHSFGPFEDSRRLVPSIIRPLSRGEAAHCTHGRQVRDFLYVEDIADAFVKLVSSDVEGPVNIGSGKGLSIREIALMIAEQVGVEPIQVKFGAIPASPGEPPVIKADVNRLFEETSWRPETELNVGLEKTVRFWEKCDECS